MKSNRYSILTACMLVSSAAQALNPKVEFVFLITSYNNEKFAERNMKSIICQKSSVPFDVICVDDCSTDRTGQIMDEYAANYLNGRIKVIHNKERSGSALENIYNVVHNYIEDHKVVVCGDGDDYFSMDRVLERLEKEYRDSDVWMTYGRFIVYPACVFWSNCWSFPEEVIRSRTFRKYWQNVPSHVKTFRASLFKKIKKEDLLYTDGKFYRKAWDMAMMYPMLEMCAPKDEHSKNHSVFIADTVLYIYNFENPLGDARNNGREEQMRLHRYIDSLPPYEPLDHL